MKINSQHLLKEAEALGLVADSSQVRMDLMKQVDSGDLTLEEVQTRLKKLKKEAKKNCLMVREDFYKNQLLDLDYIHKRYIHHNFQKLNNDLPEKPNEKNKTKI